MLISLECNLYFYNLVYALSLLFSYWCACSAAFNADKKVINNTTCFHTAKEIYTEYSISRRHIVG